MGFKRKKRVDGWYLLKGYPHFDKPLSFKKAARYVSDAGAVSAHPFLPFLGYDQVTRRYRTEKIPLTNPDGSVRKIKRRIPCAPKTRELRITPHIDGYIYAYYAKNLSRAYEATILEAGVGEHVLAYRKRLGTNIDFAKTAFDIVAARGNCVAVALDLSKFFDSIDHKILKQQWARVLKVKRLPSDHHSVFRAITNYTFVNMDECLKRLGIHRRERTATQGLCSIKEYRNVVRGVKPTLVQPNPNKNVGIPQGSPISALLSNIAMLPFDEAMHGLCGIHGWNYLRYCDDILVIGNPGEIAAVETAVRSELAKLGSSLKTNPDKTESFTFVCHGLVTEVVPEAGRSVAVPLQYLGFAFDGERIRVRSSSLSRYWRKLIRGARATKLRARRRKKDGKFDTLIKRKVYEDVTHLGGRNFVTYVKRAQQTFGLSKLGRPLKRHFARLQVELSK